MGLEKIRDTIIRSFLDAAKNSDVVLYHATGRSLLFGTSNYFNGTQPAKEFEKQCGVSDIAGSYLFPEGLTDHNVERHMLYSGYSHEDAKSLFEELQNLNPDLNNLNFDIDNYVEIEQVLEGIVSGFNVDDIQYYLDTLGEAEQKREICILNNVYNRALDIHMQWVASPETLKKIQVQMGKSENWQPPQEFFDEEENNNDLSIYEALADRYKEVHTEASLDSF